MTTYIGLIGGGNITETHARAARAIPGAAIKIPEAMSADEIWKVVQETCEGYRIIDNGDGTGSISPTITPARKRTLFIKTMAAVVE